MRRHAKASSATPTSGRGSRLASTVRGIFAGRGASAAFAGSGAPSAGSSALPQRGRLALAALLAVAIATLVLLFAAGTSVPRAAADAGCPNGDLRDLQNSTFLPDCRAYEQVTPTDKAEQGAGRVGVGENNALQAQVAADGQTASFFSFGGFADTVAGNPNYLATRGATDWSSHSIIPPQSPNTSSGGVTAIACKAGYVLFSPDLARGILIDGQNQKPGCGTDSPALVPGEPAGFPNLFVRDNTNGTYQLVTPSPVSGNPNTPNFEGASPDLTHVVFREQARLTPDSPSGVRNLYEWSGGSVKLVSLIPAAGTECTGPACVPDTSSAAGLGDTSASGSSNTLHATARAISSDGSRIIFNTADASGGGHLYLREGNRTTQLDVVQGGSGNGRIGKIGLTGNYFKTASTDGSSVFFTDPQQLTPDASGVDERQQISLHSPTGGTFKLTWDDGSGAQTTAPINFDAGANDVQTALEGLSNLNPGDISVAGSVGGPWTVTFTGAQGNENVAEITVDASGLTPSGTATINGSPTGGTFKLTFDGQTTGATGAGDTDSSSNVITGVSTATGAFVPGEALSGTNIPADAVISAVDTGAGTITFTSAGPNATGTGHVTDLAANLPYNADGATVQSALQALSNVGSGNVTVSGAAGGPYTVTFTGALAGTGISHLTADAAGLTPSGSIFLVPSGTVTTTVNGDTSTDLYRYDVDTGQVTDLTPDGTDPNGAAVQGVVGASDNASYLYFVANGALAANANSNGDTAVSGQPNLYLNHNGANTFIATLDPTNDNGDWGFSNRPWTGRVTPDGLHLAFNSTRSLTGYDNTDANTSTPDSEAFLYDVGSDQLVCASCNPGGQPPIGPSSIPSQQVPTALANASSNAMLPRAFSDDGGRLFFDSSDALVPTDTNGLPDVYEWQGGQLHLISSAGDSPSNFFDASSSDNDVFIVTRNQLVSQDTDGLYDIYDARVDGGLASQNPVAQAPCLSEGCRGAGSSPTAGDGPGTPGFQGPANQPVKRKAHKHKKKHHKAKKHHKKHRKAKHHKRAHRRAANHNRRAGK